MQLQALILAEDLPLRLHRLLRLGAHGRQPLHSSTARRASAPAAMSSAAGIPHHDQQLPPRDVSEHRRRCLVAPTITTDASRPASRGVSARVATFPLCNRFWGLQRLIGGTGG